MNRWKNHIPEGVQDFLIKECYYKRQVEGQIRENFINWGYKEVETPTFEYYDVFTSGIGSIRQEQMFKFFDHHGRILVLRPDITMPIARIAATKLKNEVMPMRLFYISNAFGYEPSQPGMQKEFTQAGIELLGTNNPEADAEVIALAISVLKNIGLCNFQIDIGQVEFFKGLLEETGLATEEIEKLREFVDQKNMLAMELFLKDTTLTESLKCKILQLPSLFGGPEILERAFTLTNNLRCRKAIHNIRSVYKILEDFELEQYISIDLGMVQNIDYYSGIIFRGISGQLGYPILTGGRYDNLVSEFGYDLPATGFAMGVKRLLIALEKQGKFEKIHQTDLLVGYTESTRQHAFSYIKEQRNNGKSVEIYMNNKETEDIIQFMKSKKIKNAVFFPSADQHIHYILEQEDLDE